jgi:hypothetical protein
MQTLGKEALPFDLQPAKGGPLEPPFEREQAIAMDHRHTPLEAPVTNEVEKEVG